MAVDINDTQGSSSQFKDDQSYSRNDRIARDSVLLTQQSKIENLIEALSAATNALREMLPLSKMPTDIEKQVASASTSWGDKSPTQFWTLPQPGSKAGLSQLSIEDILNTPCWSDSEAEQSDAADLKDFYYEYPGARVALDNCSLAKRYFIKSLGFTRDVQLILLHVLCRGAQLDPVDPVLSLDWFVWPYLSLIGLNCRSNSEWQYQWYISSSDRFKILIEIARTPVLYHKGRVGETSKWQLLTFGACLQQCYARSLLERDKDQLRAHAKIVLDAIELANVAFKSVFVKAKRVIDDIPADALINTSLRTVLCEARRREAIEATQTASKPYIQSADIDQHELLRVRDLELRILTTVGKLQIRWTTNLDDHLTLAFDGTKTSLNLYWFGRTFEQLPIYGLFDCHCADHPPRRSIVRELRLTYGVLLGRHASNTTSNRRANRKAYGRLVAPPWVLDESADDYADAEHDHTHFELQRFYDLSRPTNHSTDVCMHLWDSERIRRLDRKVLLEMMPYSEFPIYCRRLKTLVEYMEKQKAHGIRGLWRDKRDTLSWYTFWAVVFVGGVGLFLTLVSLGVSTAQTVAAFRQLNPPSATTPVAIAPG